MPGSWVVVGADGGLVVLQIHEKLRQYEKQSPSPVLHSASILADRKSVV